MYLASLQSAGCLPDSEFWPVAFDTAEEAWDFIAYEIEQIDDDGDYLTAHTALHVTDRDSPGAIPAGESTLYTYSVSIAS